jgi:hypothetical protein
MVHVPELLPRFVRKSVGTCVNVTSGAAVPWVGFTATTLSVNNGLAKFVSTVTFLRLLLMPQRKVVV